MLDWLFEASTGFSERSLNDSRIIDHMSANTSDIVASNARLSHDISRSNETIADAIREQTRRLSDMRPSRPATLSDVVGVIGAAFSVIDWAGTLVGVLFKMGLAGACFYGIIKGFLFLFKVL